MKEDGSTSLSFAGTAPCKMEDIWGDVQPSVIFQDDDPRQNIERWTPHVAQIDGGGWHQHISMQSSSSCSFSEWHLDVFRADEEEPRETTKKKYPSVQERLLIQLEQLEGEAKAVYDSITKSTDWFQNADPQKIAQGLCYEPRAEGGHGRG